MAKLGVYLLAALALTGCAGPLDGGIALAPAPEATVEPIDPVTAHQFGIMDLSGDGLIGMDEFRADEALAFAILDRNADGVVDNVEFPSAPAPRLAMAEEGVPMDLLPAEEEGIADPFDRADRNADGRVDPTEFSEGFGEWFAFLDRDGDGRLAPAEMGMGGEAARP